jgi:hypothetical protein
VGQVPLTCLHEIGALIPPPTESLSSLIVLYLEKLQQIISSIVTLLSDIGIFISSKKLRWKVSNQAHLLAQGSAVDGTSWSITLDSCLCMFPCLGRDGVLATGNLSIKIC